MKKFIQKIFIFFAIVTLIDICFGYIANYLITNSKGGVTKQMYDLCNVDEYDIIIMGSSRAHHHYVPQIITDSLGHRVYNAGQDGNGIILHYGVYQMIQSRYNPKVIIYDVFSPFDIHKYNEDANNTRYIQPLKKYYAQAGIKEIIAAVNGKNDIKMLSSIYRLNGSMISIICDYLLKRPMDKLGYAPLYGEYKGKNENIQKEKSQLEIDSLKLSYLERLIFQTKANGTKLIFTLSPIYGYEEDSNDDTYAPLKELCIKYDVPIMDFRGVKSLINDNKMWKESVHLNDNGAEEYTRNYFLPELKETLKAISKNCFAGDL